MTTTYTVKMLHVGKGIWPAMRGELYENDLMVATFKRGACVAGLVPEIETKFGSRAAMIRFDDFADSSSIAETVEALIPSNATNLR